MEDDELYLRPWEDPKYADHKFTEEEIMAEYSSRYDNNPYYDTPDGVRERLISEGRYQYTDTEYKEQIDTKIETLKKENPVTEPPTEPYWWINKVTEPPTEAPYVPLTDIIESIDEDNIDDVIQDDLIPTFINNMEDLRTCFDEFSWIRDNNLYALEGSFAKANLKVFDYSYDSLDKVYIYMLESSVPAMEKINELKEIIRNKKIAQSNYNSQKKYYDEHINDVIDGKVKEKVWVKSDEKYYHEQDSIRTRKEIPNNGYVYMVSEEYLRWQRSITACEKEMAKYQEEIDKYTEKELEIIEEIKNFEEMRLVFTDIVE